MLGQSPHEIDLLSETDRRLRHLHGAHIAGNERAGPKVEVGGAVHRVIAREQRTIAERHKIAFLIPTFGRVRLESGVEFGQAARRIPALVLDLHREGMKRAGRLPGNLVRHAEWVPDLRVESLRALDTHRPTSVHLLFVVMPQHDLVLALRMGDALAQLLFQSDDIVLRSL